MLLSFYGDPNIEGNSPVYWKFTEKMTGIKTNISGPFFYLASSASWSLWRKGALFVSVFAPLMLVTTAILSWALLREKVNLDKYILIMMLGMDCDNCGDISGFMEEMQGHVKEDEMKPDLELQADAPLDGDHHVHAEV
ncbi:WAT1-related protein At1g09380-like [Punica granatum]|uniref:WAT1-related protein At1g09380-like n=1 Tax=Punica granatum TaxID=22663 RepID=A0A6P8EG78_PUNGR|nr:WAT1-related protein At1g09380-like [Punica granatum]